MPDDDAQPTGPEIVGEHGGVLWVDPADDAMTGLAWARSLDRPTVVLLGAVDPLSLAAEAARWSPPPLAAVTLSDIATDAATQSGIDVIGTARSVTAAVLLATQVTRPGTVVLLGLAGPTIPSADFRAAVARLGD